MRLTLVDIDLRATFIDRAMMLAQLIDVHAKCSAKYFRQTKRGERFQALGAQVNRRIATKERRGRWLFHLVMPLVRTDSGQELLATRLAAIHAHRPWQGWNVGQEGRCRQGLAAAIVKLGLAVRVAAKQQGRRPFSRET